MKAKPYSPVPVMDYQQFCQMRRMVHSCCNYDDGNCFALDDGRDTSVTTVGSDSIKIFIRKAGMYFYTSA